MFFGKPLHTCPHCEVIGVFERSRGTSQAKVREKYAAPSGTGTGGATGSGAANRNKAAAWLEFYRKRNSNFKRTK